MNSICRARSVSNCAELEARPLQHVGEQLDHELLIAREERAADGDALGAGGSLDLPADRRDRLGEGTASREPAPFSQQAGQQARHSGLAAPDR